MIIIELSVANLLAAISWHQSRNKYRWEWDDEKEWNMILRLIVVSGKSCGFSGGDHNAERKRFIFPNPQTPFLCSLHNISYSVPPSEGSSVNWSVKCVSDNHNWNILLVLPDLCFTFTLLFLIKPPLSLSLLIDWPNNILLCSQRVTAGGRWPTLYSHVRA